MKIKALLIFALASSSVYAADILPPAKALVSCEHYLEVGLQLDTRYERLLKMSNEQKAERFKTLRATLENVVALGEGRPVESASTSFAQITILHGGLYDIDLHDLASSEKLAQMKQLILSAGIQPRMWIAAEGEKMPTQNYFGLTKYIVEYEYVLEQFLANVEAGRSVAASQLFDLMIRKHEVFLKLDPRLKEATLEGFTPVSFGFYGLEEPLNYPEESLIGSDIIVDVENQSPEHTIDGYIRDSRSELEQWKQARSALEAGKNVDESKLPVLVDASRLTVSFVQYRIGVLEKQLSQNLLPTKGIYRGRIVATYGAGFDIEVAPGEVYSVNVNLNARIHAVMIRPPGSAPVGN